MSKYVLNDESASVSGELAPLAVKDFIIPLSRKDIIKSLKVALVELLNYADAVKGINESIVALAKKNSKYNKDQDVKIETLDRKLKAAESIIKSIDSRLGEEWTKKLSDCLEINS